MEAKRRAVSAACRCAAQDHREQRDCDDHDHGDDMIPPNCWKFFARHRVKEDNGEQNAADP